MSAKTRVVDKAELEQLESVYQRYGGRIYLLCLRLLVDAKAAESATATTFVGFSKELNIQTDDACVLRRLHELAVEVALKRLGLLAT
ncbi:MAG: hypothetical protein WAU45_07525 [Blastocatellia bacterium]